MVAPSQNWQALGSGGFRSINEGGNAGVPVARDPLDAKRIGVAQIPSAEYPDGYLGTIRSRRDDRILDSMKARTTQKSYQRGVHKGSRVDMSAYLWPPEMLPDRGLECQAKGMHTPLVVSEMSTPKLCNDGKNGGVNTSMASIVPNDPRRQSQLASMRPAWR